ncbi:MAG: glycolate oxidase subunit GlcF [Porticoccaceae bacterium]|nr:glycolate oxidase subunit GlcF [Porticoccaceae bacterium]
MQTHFSEQQKTDPAIQRAEDALRKCVHCGFCNATCPTYQLTGNELEGPRGRITLIQDLLETEAEPSPEVITSLDHCLSCLSCESTCPSGVSYRHLIDLGRERIEQSGRRSFSQRTIRGTLARLLPNVVWFRRALRFGKMLNPLVRFTGRFSSSVAALGGLVPEHIPDAKALIAPGVYPAEGEELKRVALILGCVQNALAPEIDAATVRTLTRHGCAVVVPEKSKAGCCGALPHHLGKRQQTENMARQNLEVWDLEAWDLEAIDAVLMTASGCGSMLKDYSDLLPDEPSAKLLADKVKDLSQILADLTLKVEKPLLGPSGKPLVVAWQNPCSLQHGFKEKTAPIDVLEACGLTVMQPQDAHLCCGSAGTYNLLQSEIASQLGNNKVTALLNTRPDIIVSSNIGCMTQISTTMGKHKLPVVHLAEMVDWASGGEIPGAVNNL